MTLPAAVKAIEYGFLSFEFSVYSLQRKKASAVTEAVFTMLLTLYPNGELRARVQPTPLTKLRRVFCHPSMAESHNLSIVEKFSLNPGSFEERFSDVPLERVGFGGSPSLTPFSLYGRRKIVRSGALLGEGESRSHVLFLTGTLPGSTEESFRALSDYSAWVVNELLTHIPRLWKGTQSDCRYIWVWELQKRGALHWHCVLECPSLDAASLVRDGFRALWIRIIKGVGRKAGVDMAERDSGGTWSDLPDIWRIEAVPARKNPSRYLAKYLSKPNSTSCNGDIFPPTRWYGISRTLHSDLSASTIFEAPPRVVGPCNGTVFSAPDVDFVEKMFGLSYSSTQFSDKIRDGHTFVFYVPLEKKNEVVDAMNQYASQIERLVFGAEGPVQLSYFYLGKIARYASVYERFLNDVGAVHRQIVDDWSLGVGGHDSDLVFLDKYAYECLLREGLVSQVIPPERSGAGLTGQSMATIEPSEGGDHEMEQSSLFA